MMRGLSVRRFSNIAANPWNIGSDYRALVGGMTVIITKDDEHSQQLAKKMWFNLQTQGIQSTFITMKTFYPVSNELKDSVQLFTRAGSKSLITIGDASVTDFGKLMRKLLQSKTSIDQIFDNHTTFPQKLKYPHLSVMQSSSIHHHLPHAMMVHKEEDILQGVTVEAPSVTFLDDSSDSVKPHLSLPLQQLQLAASLFDYYFVYHYLSQVKSLSADKQTHFTNLPIIFGTISSAKDIARYSQDIAKTRVDLMKEFEIRGDLWPGVIELASNLTTTDGDFPYSLPFTYYQVAALEYLLGEHGLEDDVFSPHDTKRVLPAIKAAKASIKQLMSLTDNQLKALFQQARESILSSKAKSKGAFKKPNFTPPSTPMMAEGNTEKIAILLDAEQEAVGSLPFSAQQKKLLLDSEVLVKTHEKLRDSKTWDYIFTKTTK